MKPTLIKLSQEFHTSSGGVWLGCECPVGENEDPIEAFTIAKSTLDAAFNKLYLSYSDVTGHPMNVSQVEKRVGLLAEDILSCTDLKVLESYKLVVKGKPDLQKVYDQRLKELS